MFTRILASLFGSLFVLAGIRIIADGEANSIVRYVGNVTDWRASVEGISWTLLGIGLIFRFAVSKQWRIDNHYRRYLYEVPFIGSAIGYCVATVGSIFKMV